MCIFGGNLVANVLILMIADAQSYDNIQILKSRLNFIKFIKVIQKINKDISYRFCEW
jgi:hypothetical protein